jgi:acyl-CoA synthetase (AMP-forming)/AMP-acid ligase II
MPNVLEHALALLACERIGALPALINPRLKPDEIAGLVAHGGLAAAIVIGDAATVDAVRGALPAGAPLIAVGEPLANTTDFATCRGVPTSLPPAPRPEPQATAYVFYTSGTTGLPKGVLLPHRCADARLLYVASQCGLVHGTHNRALGLMPLFHVVGYYSVLVATLAFNGTYHVCSAFEPAAAVDALAGNEINFLYGVPTHFHALLEAPNFAPDRVTAVETLVYAGAPMPGPLLDRVAAAFPAARITNIYGTTEVMNALYMPNPVGRPERYRPGFYSNIRVGRFGGEVDDIAGVGEEGELLVDATADATFTGYLNSPDATMDKVQNGWYRTGDIAVALGDGDVELRGRVDDMILTGGENVHPDEVEAVLLAHTAVSEVAVVGVADERWGERVVACVLADGGALDGETLDTHCRASDLANYKRPRDYVFVDEIPKNASNKVLRRALRERAGAALSGDGGRS